MSVASLNGILSEEVFRFHPFIQESYVPQRSPFARDPIPEQSTADIEGDAKELIFFC
eukprot:gene29821-38977_t